jgi:hypothetical protein
MHEGDRIAGLLGFTGDMNRRCRATEREAGTKP